MLENIGLSFKGIWAHKMRSFLTMLGIIIGIASIITIVSSIKGTNEQIKRNLIGSGNNTVKVELYQDNWTYEIEYNGIPNGVPVVTEKVLNEIRACDGVEDASAYVERNSADQIYYGTTSVSGTSVSGVQRNYFDVSGYVVKKGRGFIKDDYTQFKKVIILDDAAAKSFFQQENPIGKIIVIKNEPFVVIGVVEAVSQYEPVINSIEDYYTYRTDDRAGCIFMPDTAWPIVYQYDEPQNVIVKAETTDDMTKAGKNAEEILNSYITSDDMSGDSETAVQYKSKDLLEQATEIQQLSASTNQQLIWIAGISLIVGGIGVMNIMLVSVTERTREIGLKKALGARKRRILLQFLTEASVLTSIGGIIGVICGVILAYIFSAATTAPVAISVPSIVISVVFSMIIGIIFGLIPSVKASNLNPIDALRYE